MDGQIGPRFSISSPVKVTLLSGLDRQIDCRMIGVSAAGMRFVSDEPIADGAVIAVDFEDHMAVARVRNTLPYGVKYSIGTSRIHLLPKDQPRGSGDGDPDQCLQGAPLWERIRTMLEEKGWAVELGLEDRAEISSEPGTAAAAESPAVVPAEAESTPEPEPARKQPPAIMALEPAPRLAASNSKRPVVVVVGGVALAILAGLSFLKARHSAAPMNPAAAAEPALSRFATVATIPAAPGAIHSVRLTVLEPCWITATADGKTVFAKRMEKGSQEFRFAEFAFVHLGNSHSAEISLDGATVPPSPGTGALRLVQLTAAGAKNVPWSNQDPAIRR